METINILSIDPGTNMGVTIYTVSVPDLTIVNVVTTVIDLSNHTTDDPLSKNLLLRIQIIQSYIREIMIAYQPHILAMEAAFVNSRFPKSVMYLSQYIAAIELTVTEYNPFIKIFNYAPKMVKSVVSKNGKADKNDITNALLGIGEISSKIDVTYVSEHEADSIAIGYVCVLELRSNPVLLLMI